MKNVQYKLSAMKKKLRALEEQGKKEILWKLTEEQVKYLMDHGYNIIPEIYLIKTRRFCNYKKLNALLKELHWANIKGKKEIAKKLKNSDIKILKKYEVKYYTLKYRIKLV